jgi:membrane dipeptidase
MSRIKSIFLQLLFVFSFIYSAHAQSYQKLHKKALVVDTHNDVLIQVMRGRNINDDLTGKTHSDLNRFKQGGVDAQFFSVWSDETYGKDRAFKYANQQIDSLTALINRYPSKMMLATTPKELMKAVKQKKLASLIGLEGGHMIEDKIENLESLYKRGTRYMTLTWNNSTSWATSAADESKADFPADKKGLNEHGRSIVKRMNELGMLVDLSHVGERTFWDAISIVNKPVLVSHSCVYSLCPVPRNLKDDQIRAIAKNGGVIHLNFFSGFLDSSFQRRNRDFVRRHKTEVDSLRKASKTSFEIEEWMVEKYPNEAATARPPLSILIDHIDYIVKLVGVDYVGLGSDFDGITSAPQQLDAVSDMPVITRELLARGYSKRDIRKILGENFMRVFKANTR